MILFVNSSLGLSPSIHKCESDKCFGFFFTFDIAKCTIINKYMRYNPKMSFRSSCSPFSLQTNGQKYQWLIFYFQTMESQCNKITKENILWVRKIQISLILKMSSKKKQYTRRKLWALVYLSPILSIEKPFHYEAT